MTFCIQSVPQFAALLPSQQLDALWNGDWSKFDPAQFGEILELIPVFTHRMYQIVTRSIEGREEEGEEEATPRGPTPSKIRAVMLTQDFFSYTSFVCFLLDKFPGESEGGEGEEEGEEEGGNPFSLMRYLLVLYHRRGVLLLKEGGAPRTNPHRSEMGVHCMFWSLIEGVREGVFSVSLYDRDVDADENSLTMYELVAYTHMYWRMIHDSCAACGAREKLNYCGGCTTRGEPFARTAEGAPIGHVAYCSVECQKLARGVHRVACTFNEASADWKTEASHILSLIYKGRITGVHEQLCKLVALNSQEGAYPRPRWNSGIDLEPAYIENYRDGLVLHWLFARTRGVRAAEVAGVLTKIKGLLRAVHLVLVTWLIYSGVGSIPNDTPEQRELIKKIPEFGFGMFFQHVQSTFASKTFRETLMSYIDMVMSKLIGKVIAKLNLMSAVSMMSLRAPNVTQEFLLRECVRLTAIGKLRIDYSMSDVRKEGVIAYPELLAFAQLYWRWTGSVCAHCDEPARIRCLEGCGHHVFCRKGEGGRGLCGPDVDCRVEARPYHDLACKCAKPVMIGREPVKKLIEFIPKERAVVGEVIGSACEALSRMMVLSEQEATMISS